MGVHSTHDIYVNGYHCGAMGRALRYMKLANFRWNELKYLCEEGGGDFYGYEVRDAAVEHPHKHISIPPRFTATEIEEDDLSGDCRLSKPDALLPWVVFHRLGVGR